MTYQHSTVRDNCQVRKHNFLLPNLEVAAKLGSISCLIKSADANVIPYNVYANMQPQPTLQPTLTKPQRRIRFAHRDKLDVLLQKLEEAEVIKMWRDLPIGSLTLS